MIIEPYTWHTTEITDIISVARNTIAIRVRKPTGYSFIAGQYAIVRTYTSPSRFLVRQYSFSSSPSADYIEFTIQREDGGEVTTWLHQHASVGDSMQISQSFGNFTLRQSSRPLLFIAGRIGIAPFMSFVREHTVHQAHIIYSVRSKEETCYWDEIEPFTTRIITSERPRINPDLLIQHIGGAPIVYLCGSRQFAEAMQGYLSDLGVSSGDIRRELFTL